MAAYKIRDIALALGAEAAGNLDLWVTRAAEPQNAGEHDLALAMDAKYAENLKGCKARAALLWQGADWQALGLEAAVFVPRSRLAMAHLTRMMDEGPDVAVGIHPLAVVHPTAEIGADVAIGPFVTVGAGTKIGPRTRIVSHVSIGAHSHIGADGLLLAGVKIGDHVHIGERFIAQPGASVGGDGFSFVTAETSGIEEIRHTISQREHYNDQKWIRIHSLGGIEVGDDVEIGVNSCIDRGTIRNTVVGSGTKIDNLVQIGHNARIGKDCLFCSQVGIAGSTKVGDRVVLAGQCGVNDNIFIGDDVIAGGASKIFTNVPAGRVILGSPAVKMETQVEINKALRRLPRLAAQVAQMQKDLQKS